jgi:hypothetical protein
MSNIGQEYNRGCFSTCSGLLAGILGGATAAIVFTILSIALALATCIGMIWLLGEVVTNLPNPPDLPRTPVPPPGRPRSSTEWRYLMAANLANPQPSSTIRTNVLGGILTMQQTTDMDSLKFTPDTSLMGKPIRLMDAHRKYGVSERTICNWANTGLVTVLERDTKLLIMDEASVARATAIFKAAAEVTKSTRRAGWILKRNLAASAA